jgi:predicted nucleic acid-binding protein
LILDTNGVSALADGNAAFEAAARGVTRFSIPVIVLGEFSFGILRSRHRARYESWLAQLIEASVVLDVDTGTAEHYAALRESLRRRGRPIPSNDAWIAALALQHALPLLSRDAHFDEVAGVHRVGLVD